MPARSDKLLRKFKGDVRAPLPLHPLEKALLVVVALNVCSLPWMLGGMRIWAQFISLGLSVLAFGIALIPRTYDGDLVHGEPYKLSPHRKLIRWPLFWIGLVFFGYVLTQALNPAWEFVQMENGWGMRQIDHIAWLPAGMRTPFEMMNPWRQMMIWSAPYLTACALWVGFTRRQTVTLLLTIIVANATVLGLIGIVARVTANGSILWLMEGSPDYSFASFIYKNHAGSFFALAAGITLALAVYSNAQAVRQNRRSSPASLLFFAAVVLLVCLLMSYSLFAILITGCFLALILVVAICRLFFYGRFNRFLQLIVFMVIGLSILGVVGARLVSSEKTLDRLDQLRLAPGGDSSINSRIIAWEVGLHMASEKQATGLGAGGFRFLFPKFQQTRPEILYHTHPNGEKQYAFWEHAHNDYLQLLIETGWIGVALFLTGLVISVYYLLRERGQSRQLSLMLFASCGITLIHAIGDFPFQNPAILTTFVTSWVISLIRH